MVYILHTDRHLTFEGACINIPGLHRNKYIGLHVLLTALPVQSIRGRISAVESLVEQPKARNH